MAYGTIKVDNITFTSNETDETITVSGIVQSISGNLTVTGTIQGANIIGTSTVSGATVTGDIGTFTTITGGVATLTSGVFASGVAATPSISIGTVSNGFYSPAENQVALSTSGTGRLFVDASGNVGVGQSTPEAFTNYGAITVNGTSGSLVAFQQGGVANTSRIVRTSTAFNFVNIDAKPIIFNTADQVRLHITSTGELKHLGGGTVGSPAVYFAGSAPSNSLVIDSTGKVGIGTSAPTDLLHLEQAGSSDVRLKLRCFSAGGAGGGRSSLIGFDGDNATGTNNYTYISDGTNKRLVVTNGGNVGIGTTSPTQRLQVTDGTLSNFYIAPGYNGGTGTTIGVGGGEYLAFSAAPFSTERARIDSSGRLLVGTTTTSGNNASLQVRNDNSGAVHIQAFRSSDSALAAPNISVARSRGTAASPTEVTTNDLLGTFSFIGYDGASWAAGATIEAYADDTWTDGGDTTDNPGRLVFSTTADGASSPTERMRISANGNVTIGNPNGGDDSFLRLRRTTDGNGTFYFYTNGTNGFIQNESGQGKILISTNTGIGNNNPIELATGGVPGTVRLRVHDNGVFFPTISTTASAANAFLDNTSNNSLLRSTSSLRYKTDIEDLEESKADAILGFRPVWYRSTASADRSDWSWYGLIAEEVAAIEPRLVHWTYLDDAYEEADGEKQLKPDAELVPDGVQYDRLTVLLLDVVKRQQQTISNLEARVAALESA